MTSEIRVGKRGPKNPNRVKSQLWIGLVHFLCQDSVNYSEKQFSDINDTEMNIIL